MAKVVVEPTIQQAIEQARTICLTTGIDSRECAAGWDLVEELEVAAAHQRNLEKPKTALDQYCDQHPEALQCRIYDV
jgi:hypothetical protein